MSTRSPFTFEAKTGLAYKAVHKIASTDLYARFPAFSIYACQTTLRRIYIVHHTISLSMILLVTDEAEGLRTKSTLKVPKFRGNYIVYSRAIHRRAKEDVLVEDQRVDQASLIVQDKCLC